MNSRYGHGCRGNGWQGHGRDYRILRGLKRDPARGKVSGVCAGIAGYYGISTWAVRAAALVGLVVNPILALIVYGIATLMLQPLEPPTAETAAAGGTDRAESPDGDLPPELRFAALREKFRDMEARTGGMEAEVTSKEFHLRRDFRRMGEA